MSHALWPRDRRSSSLLWLRFSRSVLKKPLPCFLYWNSVRYSSEDITPEITALDLSLDSLHLSSSLDN